MIRYAALLCTLLFLGLPASAQFTGPFPPICHASNRLTCVGGPEPGRMIWMDDGASATDCSTGGGTNGHLCVQNPDRTFSPLGGGGASSGVRTIQVDAAAGGVLCGGPLQSVANSACVTGSAIELARALTPSVANPVKIRGVGRFNEAPAINGFAQLEFDVDDIVPAVTLYGDVAGGAVKVANDGVHKGTSNIKLIVRGLWQNDAWSAPEAVIQVGCEACTGGLADTWDLVDIEVLGKVVGPHDAIQWRYVPDTAGTGNTDLARIRIHGTGEVISGRDPLTQKGGDVIADVSVPTRSVSNYCEEPDRTKDAFLNSRSGTAVGGSANTLVLNSADDYGYDGGYNMRVVTLSGAACGTAGACSGKQFVAEGYTTVDDTISFTNDPCASAITAGCGYTISAIGNVAEQRRDCQVDWGRVAALATGGSGPWKQNCFHFGINGTAAAPTAARTTLHNMTCEVEVNESSLTTTGSACPIVGAAVSNSSNTLNALDLLDINSRIEINSDIAPSSNTCPLVAGLNWPTAVAGRALTARIVGGSYEIVNNGEPNRDTAGMVYASTHATGGTLSLSNVGIRIDNPVAGYANTQTTLVQAAQNNIVVEGPLSADDLITVTAATPSRVSGWQERCMAITDGAGTAFARQMFPLSNAFVGTKVQAVACSCKGTCGANPTVDLFAGPGARIGGTPSVTCTVNQTAMSYTDVSTDTDGTLASGTIPEIDDTATFSGTAGDDLLVCLRTTTNRWMNH